MEIFNNRQRTGYEEIVSYGPRWWTEYREMDANYRFAGWTLDLMAYWLERIVNNQFPLLADEETIEMLERLLKIDPEEGSTLDERRRVVAMFLSGLGRKICRSVIIGMVKAYTGQDCDVYWDGENLVIAINHNNGIPINLSVLFRVLRRRLPAHIGWGIAIVYVYEVAVEKKRTNYLYSYDFSGTKPDITLHGDLNLVELAVEASRILDTADYRRAMEKGEIAGINPDIALHGQKHDAASVVEEDKTTAKSDYRQSKETGELTGVAPDIGTHGKAHSIGAAVSESEKNAIYGHQQTGIKPDIATHGWKRNISSAVKQDEENTVYGIKQTGLDPGIALLGNKRDASVITREEEDSIPYSIRQTKADGGPAGTAPDISTHGSAHNASAAVRETDDSSIYRIGQAGTSPDISSHGGQHSGITAETDVKAVSYGADYILCGTTAAHN